MYHVEKARSQKRTTSRFRKEDPNRACDRGRGTFLSTDHYQGCIIIITEVGTVR